jgi:hypothetical protein
MRKSLTFESLNTDVFHRSEHGIFPNLTLAWRYGRGAGISLSLSFVPATRSQDGRGCNSRGCAGGRSGRLKPVTLIEISPPPAITGSVTVSSGAHPVFGICLSCRIGVELLC